MTIRILLEFDGAKDADEFVREHVDRPCSDLVDGNSLRMIWKRPFRSSLLTS